VKLKRVSEKIFRLKSLQNLKRNKKWSILRHSRVGGNLGEIFAMDCFYMSFLISNKIPAYAGMTAFLCFQAAVRVLQRFQAAFLFMGLGHPETQPPPNKKPLSKR